MAPAASNQGSTTNPPSEPFPWSVVAVVFIVLFALTLLAGGLALRRLARGGSPPPPPPNPHPFGTEAWHTGEEARAPQAERDALAIASLEAQVGMLEEAGEYLDRTVELLEGRNRALERELAEERRRYEPVDPEVMRRACEAMHRPIARQPAGRPVLQLAKVRVIVDENSGASPQRTTRVVESPAGLQARSCAASLVDDPFADCHGAGEEDSCSGKTKADSA